MLVTRKIGKFLRGKATAPQVMMAAVLGGALGFLPGTFRQEIGLVLALRLMDGPAAVRAAAVHHPRDLEESEDRISVDLGLSGGRRIEINARVDADSDADRHHTVLLHTRDRRTLAVRGRNLEAGLGEPATAPTDRELRVQMYTAAMNASHAPARHHPCLFPLRALGRPLEVIDGIYRHAYTHRPSSAPPAPA